MFSILYNIIITPLEYLIENIFSFFLYYINIELGATIFFVSFAVTMMCLPFYYRADKISKEENEKFSELKPYIDKIKKNFKGDEQFFMLQTIYRQHNYHPIMALRNSFSLLLQIPFFIAAYHFFSNLELLNGYSWGLIKDYAQPDMLLDIAGLKINILPIIMTFINIVSCELYLKTKSLKARIQPYSLALFFLIFLYNSPSGLVLYWTYNNFFYLLKNKFMDDEKPLRFITHLFIFISILTSFLIYKQNGLEIMKNKIYELLIIISPCIFLFIILKIRKKDFETISENLSEKFIFKAFLSCSLGMVLLQGLIIPLGLLNTDLSSFIIELDNTNNLIHFVLNNALILTGLYLFWGTINLAFSSKKLKSYFIVILLPIFLFSLFNYLTFDNNLGTIDTNLRFDNDRAEDLFSGNVYSQVTNIIIFIILLILSIHFFKKNNIKPIIFVLLIVLFSEITVSGIIISKFIKGINYIDHLNQINNELWTQSNYINLSKTNKNVIIIFLDRYLGAFLPKILEEKPELKEVYSGFVFYPNTVSYAVNTVLGYPPCVGGYEYTPLKLDKDNRPFSEKWEEASIMLLTLFKKNGFLSTVVDPEGDNDPNMMFCKDGFYSNYYSANGINYLKMQGKHNSKFQFDKLNDSGILEQIKKRIYYYSFLNIVPKSYKKLVYNKGFYLLKRRFEDLHNDIYYSEKAVMNAYSALIYLKQITKTDSKDKTFTIIHNGLPHSLFLFQLPNYDYSRHLTNVGENKFKDEKSFLAYHTSMASTLLIAQYLNYLKQSGVYDNTKIIIMADHGNKYVQFNEFSTFINDVVLLFNPLLMVKDFNQNSSLKSDYTFMTNADVPSIAIKDLISDAKNPFTGKNLTLNDKQNGATIYLSHSFWKASHFTTNRVILNESPIILHVKDDIFNKNNWSKVDYSSSE